MTASSEHVQKGFKLTIVDGLPEATVEIIGTAHWLPCCPLCGCTHQIISVNENVPYIPLCQTQPVLYKVKLGSWHQRFPEVKQYAALHLVQKAA